MKTFRLSLKVVLLVALATITLSACATQGPRLTLRAWSQTYPVSTRFIVLSNLGGAAVLDRETALVWELEPSAAMLSLHDARYHCSQLTTGGRMGWRLPLTHEIYSLLDPSQINPGGSAPALPLGHPFKNVWGGAYRVLDRAAPPFNNPSQMYVVYVGGGIVNLVDATDTLFGRTWCVRGPVGTPSPW